MYSQDIPNYNYGKEYWKENLTSFSRVKLISKSGSLKSDLREEEGYEKVILHVSALQFPKYLLHATIRRQIPSKMDYN